MRRLGLLLHNRRMNAFALRTLLQLLEEVEYITLKHTEEGSEEGQAAHSLRGESELKRDLKRLGRIEKTQTRTHVDALDNSQGDGLVGGHGEVHRARKVKACADHLVRRVAILRLREEDGTGASNNRLIKDATICREVLVNKINI